MNPFDDDYGQFGATTGNINNFYPRNDVCSRSNMLQTQISDSQTRTRASQQRALSSILNSEEIGIAAAQELVDQGEKLNKAEDKLNAIGEIQKESQRKINTLSSVFGGFKNMFYRRSVQAPQVPITKPNDQPSVLKDNINERSSHVRSISFNDQLQKETTNLSSSHDAEFERNMNLMNDGMSRLKNLANSMNQELISQNKQLDRMTPQINQVNETMSNQSKQMNKLLGIKPK